MTSFTTMDTEYDSDESLYNTYHNYDDTVTATREELLLALQTLMEGNETDEEKLSPTQEKLHDNLNFSMYSKEQLIFSVLGQTAMISHGQLWIQASYHRVDSESRQKTTYRLLQFLLTGGAVYMQAGGTKWGHNLLFYKEDEDEDDDELDSDEDEVDSEFSSPLEEYLRIFQELRDTSPDFSKNTIHTHTLHSMEALDIDTSNFQTRQAAVRAFAEFLGIAHVVPVVE